MLFIGYFLHIAETVEILICFYNKKCLTMYNRAIYVVSYMYVATLISAVTGLYTFTVAI